MKQPTVGLPLPATFRGRVVPGSGRGRRLGFPTANVAVAGAIPRAAWGVYTCWVEVAGRRYAGVAHLGPAATFGDDQARFEVHLLDWAGTLAGAVLSVQLVERIRGTKRFASGKDLAVQMRRDVACASAQLRRTGDTGAGHRAAGNRALGQRGSKRRKFAPPVPPGAPSGRGSFALGRLPTLG